MVSAQRVVAFELFVGSVKGEDFYRFLFNVENSRVIEYQNAIVYLDNCRSHHKKEFAKPLRSRLSLHFAPPYSPQLSLVEYCFNVIRSKLRYGEGTWSREMLQKEIIQAVSEITQDYLMKTQAKIITEVMQDSLMNI